MSLNIDGPFKLNIYLAQRSDKIIFFVLVEEVLPLIFMATFSSISNVRSSFKYFSASDSSVASRVSIDQACIIVRLVSTRTR